jgi:hypothetical protein
VLDERALVERLDDEQVDAVGVQGGVAADGDLSRVARLPRRRDCA